MIAIKDASWILAKVVDKIYILFTQDDIGIIYSDDGIRNGFAGSKEICLKFIEINGITKWEVV